MATFDQIPGFDIPHRVVPVSRRADLRSIAEAARRDGRLDPLIWENYVKFFRCPLPRVEPPPASIIVAAVPHPASRIPFAWKGRAFRLTVPPSYVRYDEIIRAVEARLNALLAPAGGWAGRATVPQKTLAVRSGLGRYGRNNLVYVPGLGSWHMLVTYYSSLAATADPWDEPRLLERCATCRACVRACPSGAVREDAMGVRQERCLTFYSGYSGPQELPGWLDRSWLRCLIGCLRCQEACPENRAHRDEAVDESLGFDAGETARLAAGLTPEDVPPEIRVKLERLGIAEFFGLGNCLQMLRAKLSVFLPRVESGEIPSTPVE